MEPNDDFFEKAKLMEQLFKTFHGEKALNEEENSVGMLSNYIKEMVKLPDEVILCFIKCRTYFRNRNLNANLVK